MIKKYIFTVLVSFGLVLVIHKLYAKSSGAPPHSTGAPGEQTCNAATCHVSAVSKPNTGTGKTYIKFEDSTNTFEPGKQYLITVGVEQTGLTRYGFQATALNQQAKGYGELVLKDSKATNYHVPESAGMLDRVYINQTGQGNTFTNGKGQWQFYWNAPDPAEGAVTFYAAFLAGNKDNAKTGDYVYTTKLTVQQKGTNGVESNLIKPTRLELR